MRLMISAKSRSVFRSLDGSRRLAWCVAQLTPPRRMRGHPVRKGERRKLGERALIHGSLEVDDLAHRIPVVRPAPLIELGFIGPIERELRVVALQAQQEPALFLADT